MTFTTVPDYPTQGSTTDFEEDVRDNYNTMRSNQAEHQVELVAAAGTATDLHTRLAVALEQSGALKSTPPVGGLWTEEGAAGGVTFVSTTSFTVNGVDLTTIYTARRAIRLNDTLYGYVLSSSFSTNTTVTLTAAESDDVPDPLTKIEYGQEVAQAPLDVAYKNNIITEPTTARTFAITDNLKYIRTTSASATTLTFPPNSSVAFPIGGQIEGFHAGADSLTFAKGSGVTVNSLDDALTISGQYGGWSAKKVGTDEWDLVGAISA